MRKRSPSEASGATDEEKDTSPLMLYTTMVTMLGLSIAAYFA